MADRVTELRIKGTDGAFSEAYPIGAKAENVYLSNETSVEDALQALVKVSEEILVLTPVS